MVELPALDCLKKHDKFYQFLRLPVVRCLVTTHTLLLAVFQDGSFLLLGAPGLNDWTGEYSLGGMATSLFSSLCM